MPLHFFRQLLILFQRHHVTFWLYILHLNNIKFFHLQQLPLTVKRLLFTKYFLRRQEPLNQNFRPTIRVVVLYQCNLQSRAQSHYPFILNRHRHETYSTTAKPQTYWSLSHTINQRADLPRPLSPRASFEQQRHLQLQQKKRINRKYISLNVYSEFLTFRCIC